MADRQIREIIVKVDSKDSGEQIRQMAKGFGTLNKSVKETTSVLNGMRQSFNAIAGFTFAGIGISKIVEVADAMQKMTDRLNLSEGSFEAARRTMGLLNDVANENKVSIESMSEMYTRLNNSLGDTGITTNALLGLTDLLQKSFRLSGSTAQEATSSVIQLSQGLASGQVRGQELRAVLEGNALAGQLLAKQLGITRGELLKYSEKNDGIKASVFLAAFANEGERINQMAAKLRPTIGEALTTAFNDLKVQLSDVNREFEITEKVVSVIDFAAKNIGTLTAALVASSIAWKVYTADVTIASLANSKFALTAAGATAALGKGLLAALGFLVTPMGVIIATATALAGAFALVASESPGLRGFLSDVGDGIKDFNEKAYESSKKTVYWSDAVYKAKDAVKDFSGSYRNIEAGKEIFKGFNEEFEKIVQGKAEKISTLGDALLGFSKSYEAANKGTFNYKESLVALNEEYLKTGNVSKYNQEVKKIEIRKLTDDFKKGELNLDAYNRRLHEINFGKPRDQAREYQLALADLNKRFEQNKMTLAEYANALDSIDTDKIDRGLKRGKQNVLDFNKAVAENKVKDLNRAFSDNKITMDQFNEGIRQNRIRELTNQFKAGIIDIHTFNAEITKTSEKFMPGSALSNGINDYINSAGTLSQGISTVVTNTFGHLEDTMVEFTKTGKFNFKDFANSVLEDLNRIIIRSLIIRPLAQGLLGLAGPSVDAAGGTTQESADYLAGRTGGYAKGGYFPGGIQKFASGGVVTGRTNFLHSGGRGVAGEAGRPEAIIPLKRNRGGDLGVAAAPSNTVINIVNQSGGEVEQKETTDSRGNKTIEILIHSTVKQGMAAGFYDKQLNQQYGLRRKGM